MMAAARGMSSTSSNGSDYIIRNCLRASLLLLCLGAIPGALWEETDILTKKPGGPFRCLCHVGTRLEDPEKVTSATKSVVPYLPILSRAFFSVC